MSLILLDTNILISSYDQNDPTKQTQAILVMEWLHQSNAGRISVQSLAEFINLAMKKLKPPLSAKEALSQAGLLSKLWYVYDLTPEIVLEAGRGVRDYHLAYYDAQIWATARLNQVPVVFSEDFQDRLTLETVTFINPFLAEFRIEEWI